MPEMGGYELATRLRKDAALTDTMLVAVSAWDVDMDKLTEVGINYYMPKPVHLNTLKLALQR